MRTRISICIWAPSAARCIETTQCSDRQLTHKFPHNGRSNSAVCECVFSRRVRNTRGGGGCNSSLYNCSSSINYTTSAACMQHDRRRRVHTVNSVRLLRKFQHREYNNFSRDHINLSAGSLAHARDTLKEGGFYRWQLMIRSLCVCVCE